LKFNISKILLS